MPRGTAPYTSPEPTSRRRAPGDMSPGRLEHVRRADHVHAMVDTGCS